jgi:hypothetical protein
VNTFGGRLVGALLFLLPAVVLFEVAGRLAGDLKPGWGWFLFAGLLLAGGALNLWTGEQPAGRRRACPKPGVTDDWG